MKIANHLRRVLAATLFGLGCYTAALHAQNIMLHLDAPQGIDAQTLAADIGTLKITFSNSKDFFDTSLYAANTLDFGSDYYNNGKDSYHHYFSRELTLNADDGNGNAWWGNTNKVWLNYETVRRQVSGRTGQPIYYRIYNPHFSRIITGQIDPTDADEVTLHHTELTQARRVAFMPPVGRDGNAVSAIFAPTCAQAPTIMAPPLASICTTSQNPLHATPTRATPCATLWPPKAANSPCMPTPS